MILALISSLFRWLIIGIAFVVVSFWLADVLDGKKSWPWWWVYPALCCPYIVLMTVFLLVLRAFSAILIKLEELARWACAEE